MEYVVNESEALPIGCYSGENVLAMMIAVKDRKVLSGIENGPGVSGTFSITHLYEHDEGYRYRSTTGTGLQIRVPDKDTEDHNFKMIMAGNGFGAMVRHFWEHGYRHFTLQAMPNSDEMLISCSMTSIAAAVKAMETKDYSLWSKEVKEVEGVSIES